VVEALAKDELLPAIVFIFSRAGCDRAAAEVGEVCGYRNHRLVMGVM